MTELEILGQKMMTAEGQHVKHTLSGDMPLEMVSLRFKPWTNVLETWCLLEAGFVVLLGRSLVFILLHCIAG